MKILFTHKLLDELIEQGYLYLAYFDGRDRTILYPFKLPLSDERLVQLNFHQLPIDDLVVSYLAKNATEKQIYIADKYFPVLSE
jgi:hypothetical protein